MYIFLHIFYIITNNKIGDKMRVSWMKYKGDDKSFRMFKGLGFDVYEIENPDEVDLHIEKLIENNYHTIVLSNEIAGFSEDIIKKYDRSKDVNIIIAPSKRNNKQ